MNIVQGFDCLDLYDDTLCNQKVGDEISDQNILVMNFDPALLGYWKASLREFHSQRIFIDFFKKSGAKDVAYLMYAADYPFCDLIQP